MAGIQSHTKVPSSKVDVVSNQLEATDELIKNFVSGFECSIAENKANVWKLLNNTPFADFHSSSPSLAIGPPQETKYLVPLGTNSSSSSSSSSSSVQNKIANITDNNPWRTHICKIRDEYGQLYSNLTSTLESLKSPIKTIGNYSEAIQNMREVTKCFVIVQAKSLEIVKAVSSYLDQENTTSLPVTAGALTAPQSNRASQSKPINPSPNKQVAQQSLNQYYRRFEILKSSDDDSDS